MLVVVLVLASVGCAGSGEGTPREERQIPPVEAIQARSGRIPLEQRLSGVVKADNQVSIRAQVEAPVVAVRVRSGERVGKGQELVRLEDDPLREQLRQAQANLRLAEAAAEEAVARVQELRAQVTRSRRLAEENLIARVELETQEAQIAAAKAAAARAQASVDQARALVQERRSALSKTVIRAPVAGHVGQMNVEVGMLVDPATELFTIGNLNDLVVEVPLSESMLSFIEEGLPVRITSDSLKEPVPAKLSRISPFLARESFSTIGEIDVENSTAGLRPGMFVNVDVLYGETESATLVPNSAIWKDPQTGVEGIFVVQQFEGKKEQEAQVEFRDVNILGSGGGIAGLGNVRPGDWVVTVGQHLLARGKDPLARVRPTSWEKVLSLQQLQREDLLKSFLEEQQRIGKEQGAKPPSNREFMETGNQTAPGAKE